MDQRDKYRSLCKYDHSIPIFCQDWWLDAVCGNDRWDVLLVETNGQVVAALPYYKPVISGLILQPPMTPFNGIVIFPPEDYKRVKQNSFCKKVSAQLIDQLDDLNLSFYTQSFHHSITNWLPFYWKGYHQTTRYTYLIENIHDLESIWIGLTSERRSRIRHAQKEVEIKDSDDTHALYGFNRLSFLRQRQPVPISRHQLKQIDQACASRGCRKLSYAIDQQGNIHAAIYTIWDASSVYYLMGGVNPLFGSSGAMSLLMWNAIQHASEMGKKFDFEGSMIEPIESFFSSFGAVQTPYFNIWKGSLSGWILYYGFKAVQKAKQSYFTFQDRDVPFNQKIPMEPLDR